MENDFLLATSDEFYYDGMPKSNFSFTTVTNTEVISDAPITINETIGAAITIVQIVGAFIAIILWIIGIKNIIQNNITSKNKIDEKYELSGDKDNLNEEKIKKKPTVRYFIFGIILYMVSGIFQITKNFAKPIIYIYPEKEEEVKIKVKNPEKLTCTYPKYEDEWNVLAKPNGELVDLKTNRKLYALYWEGMGSGKVNLTEGFVIEGENVTKFLEEKLEILGLNEREAEEFIVYWLPLMEKNKYNYIRFETLDEINENMGLEITPKPDTLIRINMEFKGLRKPFEVKEQQLEKLERKGYTVVEWGGTKL